MDTFYISIICPEYFLRKLWYWMELFSYLIHCISQWNEIAPLSSEYVCISLCHYWIYVWRKSTVTFLHGTYIVENFSELVWHSALQCTPLVLVTSPFLFCQNEERILINNITYPPFLRLEPGLGIQKVSDLSHCTNIFLPLDKCHFP